LADGLGILPSPETKGRFLVALEDYIDSKIGKNSFGCETIFDHAAKANLSDGGYCGDEDMLRGNTLEIVVANRHRKELSILSVRNTFISLNNRMRRAYWKSWNITIF
jgi:hypothetical protein